ncbi:MAG: DUF262 domain-containing protein [Proteobacteria bacterium]|nr:DUF262 domain-containing protein [Pseudomonadota bacterium]
MAETLRTQFRVSDFVAWQRDKTLQLNPDFQRRHVWKKGAKSFLIDTILRGLPIPIIFMRDLRTNLKTMKPRRDVVDGQQRIRTILAFVDRTLLDDFDERDEFTIDGAHNEKLADKTFADLLEPDRQKILDYQFSVHSFPSDTDDREILQIFARMNSTGVKLNAQELRNAEYYGRFKTLAYALATEQLNRWRNWKIFSSDQIMRMLEVELTSEFMLLIMRGVLQKNNKTINKHYMDYDGVFPSRAEVAKRFRATFDSIETLFGAEIALFKNRSIFYALFATVYGLQYGLLDPKKPYAKLSKVKPKAIKPLVITHIKEAATKIKNGEVPPDVLKASRGATAHEKIRRILIGFLAGKDNPCRQPR